MNFAKFLRISFLQNTSRLLLLSDAKLTSVSQENKMKFTEKKVYLIKFTDKIPKRKLHFLCSVCIFRLIGVVFHILVELVFISLRLRVLHQHQTNRKSYPKVFCKKGVSENFAEFTEKHLYRSLFFNKVAGLTLKFIPAGIYWFKFNNGAVLVSLLLTLNRFHTLV